MNTDLISAIFRKIVDDSTGWEMNYYPDNLGEFCSFTIKVPPYRAFTIVIDHKRIVVGWRKTTMNGDVSTLVDHEHFNLSDPDSIQKASKLMDHYRTTK